MTNTKSTDAIMPGVIALVANALTVSPELITETLAYGDIPEWDSLGHMNILMALEEKYAVGISGEVITNLTSIEKIVHFLTEEHHD